jgi:protocatechuate 3,4-dioxygenase beta subunit
VEGTVVSAGGSGPLRGARVTLSASDPERRSTRNYSASTDGNGHFLINGIAPGRYLFHASKPGFVAQSYRPSGSGSPETILELFSGQKLDGVQFALSRGGVILGRVNDENGEPVVGVQVEALVSRTVGGTVASSLLKGQWFPVKETTTNDLGEYRLFGLNPGRYYVAAIDSGIPELGEATGIGFTVARAAISAEETVIHTESEGSVSRMASFDPDEIASETSAADAHPPVYYPGVTRREDAQKIRLSAGQEIRVDISLRSEKTVTVSGNVLDIKGKPAAQTTVLLRSQNLESMLSSLRNAAVTDADGKFEIKGVIPGSYMATATSTRDLKGLWAEQPLEVAGEDVAGIQLQLSGGVKLSGKLLAGAAGDVDLATMSIFLVAPGGPEHSGWADVKKDGDFSFPDLRNTTYSLLVNNVPDGWYVSSASFGSDNVLESGLRVGDGIGSRTLDITVKPGAGQVDGLVLMGDDPAPGATVKLLPDHSSPYRQDSFRAVPTDQRGRFIIKNVVPGSYRLLAVAGKSDGEDDEDSPDDSSLGTSLALAEKESKTVQLKLVVREQ